MVYSLGRGEVSKTVNSLVFQVDCRLLSAQSSVLWLGCKSKIWILLEYILCEAMDFCLVLFSEVGPAQQGTNTFGSCLR